MNIRWAPLSRSQAAPALKRPARRPARPLPGRLALVAGLLAASVTLAAPVLDTDDLDGADAAAQPLAPSRSTNRPGSRPAAAAVTPEASTGNRNLDLLLEFQGRPGEVPPPLASPASAAAAAAAADALADLRAQAARQQALDQRADRAPRQPFDGTGTVGLDDRPAQRADRRDWAGRPATAAGQGGFDGGRAAADASGRAPGAAFGAYDDGDGWRHLPREVVRFLREHRYWLLGALAAAVAIGAGLKSYSRRI